MTRSLSTPWARAVIALGLVGALTAGLVLSPVGAAFNPTKKRIKKIATKVVDRRLGCAIGTTPFAGSCMEQVPRPQADFAGASVVCTTAGRRLPTLSELLAYEAAGNELETFGFGEGSSDVHEEGGTSYWWTVQNGGLVAATSVTNPRAFRCLGPMIK